MKQKPFAPIPWYKKGIPGIKGLLKYNLEPIDVAVVDSGIDATHPALADRVVSAVRVEQKRDAYHIAGVPNHPTNQDIRRHGTAVAGIIAQVAPNARIHDIRIFDQDNAGSGFTNVAGFRHAVEQGYSIVNMAIVCGADQAIALQKLCEEAYKKNILVVAARRNVFGPDFGFPAQFSSCISVGNGQFSSPYKYRYTENPPVEFIALGQGLKTATPKEGYECVDGTSFAAATMSGLCAIIRGAYPDLAPFEVKTFLKMYASR